MNYISAAFLAFFPCLLIVYALTPNRHKWKTLLVFSIVFYASNGWEKLLFILGTSVVVYVVSRKIESIYRQLDAICEEKELSSAEKKELRKTYAKRSRRMLWLTLAFCLSILCYCKFAARVVTVFNGLTGGSLAVKVIVPLGVSYYTFSSIGYLLDIHWRKVTPEHSYPRLLLCMIYFPHVVSGPISRYEKLLPQFDTLTNPSYDRLCMGLQLMLWGYFKKIVIADRLAIFVNDVFGNIPGNVGLIYPVALVLGAFQAYTDFSGCMDIVEGASEVLGVQLERNFNHPFFSRSAAEFWRRWHITLGNWFKDYVYVPVTTSSLTRKLRRKASKRFGANGGKVVMTVIPLGTVWLLTGIWHGTGKNYIVWGLYWGFLIICATLFEKQYSTLAKVFRIDTERKAWRYFQMLRTFCLYAAGLLPILAKGLHQALMAAKQMLSVFNPWIFWDESLYAHGLDRRNFMLAILSIVFLLCVERLQERESVRQVIARQHIILRWGIYFAGIFAVLIFGIYGPGYDAAAFLYEGF